MTEQEAKLILDVRISRFDHAGDVNEALEIAKQALEEIQQYREIGNLEECREAAEKQKAKRPTIQKERFSSNTYNCPTCGNRLINRDIAGWYGGKRYKFCHECGQSIQWDEDLEGIDRRAGEQNE